MICIHEFYVLFPTDSNVFYLYYYHILIITSWKFKKDYRCKYIQVLAVFFKYCTYILFLKSNFNTQQNFKTDLLFTKNVNKLNKLLSITKSVIIQLKYYVIKIYFLTEVEAAIP